MKEPDQMFNTVIEYEHLLENLRLRLHVLNTSVFLLENNLHDTDKKTNAYLKRINGELEKIRQLIIYGPEYKQIKNIFEVKE